MSGVKVKALPWQKSGVTSLWSGELIFGVHYTMYDENSGWRLFRGQFLSEFGDNEIAYGTLDACKAAAQADFEARIRSALDTAPAAPATGEETEALWRAITEAGVSLTFPSTVRPHEAGIAVLAALRRPVETDKPGVREAALGEDVIAKLDADSLDYIVEVVGDGPAVAEYNRGKSVMRAWFLARLRTLPRSSTGGAK